MKALIIGSASLGLLAASSAVHAGDAAAGGRLAQQRCVVCHVVGQGTRSEVAAAPPFTAIGRKFDFETDALAAALMGPHRRMNFSLRKRDADDVAAYIATLAR